MRSLALLVGGGVLGAVAAAVCWSQERAGRSERAAPQKPAGAAVPRELLAPLDFDDADAALWKAVDRSVTIDVKDTPLTKVCELLAKEIGIRFVLEPEGLAEAGVKPQHVVSLHTKDLPLRRALRQLLRPLGLTWQIADGAVVITSGAQAERNAIVRLYPVVDLVVVPDPENGGVEFADAELLELIVTFVAPESWEENDGPGVVGFSAITLALVVETSESVHDEVESFLNGLRAARRRAALLVEHLGWPEVSAIQAAYLASLANVPMTTEGETEGGPDRGIFQIHSRPVTNPGLRRFPSRSRFPYTRATVRAKRSRPGMMERASRPVSNRPRQAPPAATVAAFVEQRS